MEPDDEPVCAFARVCRRQLVGIVSIGDVVKHRLEDLETESNVLRDAYIAAH